MTITTDRMNVDAGFGIKETVEGPSWGDSGVARAAAVSLLFGAIGVIATSALYAFAGPEAALPGGATGMEAVRSATAASASYMRAAGSVGMPSDVLLAVGAVMFAALKRGRNAGLSIAGWLAMAVAGALFIVVDAMVGFVLPAAAAQPGGEAAYLAMRSLFDVLFAIGAFTTGVGALAAAWSAQWPEFNRRAVAWAMRGVGLVGVFAGVSYVAGLQGSRLMGPGIALFGVTLAVLASFVMRTSIDSARKSPVS